MVRILKRSIATVTQDSKESFFVIDGCKWRRTAESVF